MTAPLDRDDFAREVERIADEYARQHNHAPVTEDRAAQMWADDYFAGRLHLDGPDGYIGRRRANEDGTRMDQVLTVDSMWPDECPDPILHRHWDYQAGRTEASYMRTARGCCGWCSKPVKR